MTKADQIRRLARHDVFSSHSIARFVGCSRRHVREVLQNQNRASYSDEVATLWADCRRYDISQRALAAQAGVARDTVGRIFRGESHQPKPETLQYMREAINDILEQRVMEVAP